MPEFLLSLWRPRPTGTSDFPKTNLFVAPYVSSYVKNRFESQLFAHFRVDTFSENIVVGGGR